MLDAISFVFSTIKGYVDILNDYAFGQALLLLSIFYLALSYALYIFKGGNK